MNDKCPKCGAIFKQKQKECLNCHYKIKNFKLIFIIGCLFSFLFPLLGVFIGFYLNSKEQQNGKHLILISLVVLFIMLLIPWTSDINQKYYYYYN